MATRKSTTTKKNDEFVLTDDILVGKIQIADKQHIAISLVKHEGKSYLSIKKTYTKKDGEVRTKSCVWIPFDKAKYLPDIINTAVFEGVARHFDESYKEPEVIEITDDDPWSVKWFK